MSLLKLVRNLLVPSGLGMKILGAAHLDPSISSITPSLHSFFSSHLMVSLQFAVHGMDWHEMALHLVSIQNVRTLRTTVQADPQIDSHVFGVI